MTNEPEKFFFNLNNFDNGYVDPLAKKKAEEEALRRAEEEAKKEDLPPPPPTFSEEELENAKKAAFEEGRTQGKQDMREKHDRKHQNTLNQIAAGLPQLIAQAAETQTNQQLDTLRLCLTIFEKIFPHYSREQGMHELSAAIRDTLKQTNSDLIEITVHPDSLKAIEDDLKTFDSDSTITITPNDNIEPGNCTMKWRNGGATHSPADISEQIHAILTQTIEENAINPPLEQIEDSPAPQDCAMIDSDIKEQNTAAPDNTTAQPDDDDGES